MPGGEDLFFGERANIVTRNKKGVSGIGTRGGGLKRGSR